MNDVDDGQQLPILTVSNVSDDLCPAGHRLIEARYSLCPMRFKPFDDDFVNITTRSPASRRTRSQSSPISTALAPSQASRDCRGDRVSGAWIGMEVPREAPALVNLDPYIRQAGLVEDPAPQRPFGL